MDKIKDFFYNINDLIVALLIILVAAYVILWKVDDIMGYPEYAMAQEINANPPILSDETGSDTPAVPDDKEPIGSGVVETPEPEVDEPVKETPTQPVNKIEINIPSGSAGITIANTLKEKGLIDSTSAFVNRLSERKLDVKLRAGKFKIPDNATLDEIINILTGQ